jgi:hypothetical protein
VPDGVVGLANEGPGPKVATREYADAQDRTVEEQKVVIGGPGGDFQDHLLKLLGQLVLIGNKLVAHMEMINEREVTFGDLLADELEED